MIEVADGQLAYELAHLTAKLKVRDPAALSRLPRRGEIDTHPLFTVVKGGIADWEVR